MRRDILTITICTRNRSKMLEYCISSLINQNKTNKFYSLLIVDNNSSDDTENIYNKYKNIFLNSNYIFEPNIGLSNARNRAIKECGTDWIAFIDDDAIARKDWIHTIYEIIENYNYDIFGGIYLPWYLDGKVSWYKDEYATNSTWLKYQERIVLEKGTLSGGNCVFKRSLFKNHYFDNSLGQKGDRMAYGEESRIQNILRNEGAIIGFVPDMVIYHYVPLSKQKISWFFRREFANGRDSYKSRLEIISRGDIAKRFLMLPYKLIRLTVKNIIVFLTGKEKIENCIINIGGKLSYEIGRIYYGIKR